MQLLVMCNTYQYIVNIDIFIRCRDTILAFECINKWTVLVNLVFLNLPNFIPKGNYKL